MWKRLETVGNPGFWRGAPNVPGTGISPPPGLRGFRTRKTGFLARGPRRFANRKIHLLEGPRLSRRQKTGRFLLPRRTRRHPPPDVRGCVGTLRDIVHHVVKFPDNVSAHTITGVWGFLHRNLKDAPANLASVGAEHNLVMDSCTAI